MGEITTTQTNYLGGLIKGGSSSTEVKELPPTWTQSSTDALNNYMLVSCLNELSLSWTHQGPLELPELLGRRDEVGAVATSLEVAEVPAELSSVAPGPSLASLVQWLHDWLGSVIPVVHQPASGVAGRVQRALTSLSQSSNLYNLPGIENASIISVMETMSPPFEVKMADVFAAEILASDGQGWESLSTLKMTNSSLKYFSAFFAWDDIGYTRHLTACTIDTAFKGEEVEVKSNMTCDDRGHQHTSQEIIHSKLTQEDLKQLLVEFEYLCNANTLETLQGSAGKSVLIKYHPYMLQARAAAAVGPGYSSAMDGIMAIISSVQNSIDGFVNAIGNFLRSSSQSTSFLSRAGEFSRYSSKTSSFHLVGVETENLLPAIGDILSTMGDIPPETLKRIQILTYGTKNQSGWTTHVAHFNETTGGDATTMMAFHTPNQDGTHDIAVCAVGATFQVLGDIEVITTNTQYLGGLIQGGSQTKEIKYPPAWTTSDTDALNNYMIVECLNDLSQTWTGQGPVQLPDLPQPKVEVVVV